MTILPNKVAIVTGSTSGIGEAVVKMFSAEGVRVVINSVSSVDEGKRMAESLPNAIYCQGDISNETDCQNIVNAAVQNFGQLDILVNNAGKPIRTNSNGPLDISNENFLETLNANVVGTWCITRAAIPYLKKSGDGNIVNITSSAGLHPATASSGALAYSVAKSGINHMTKFLAKECGPEIRVNAIAPGLIVTPRTEGATESIDKFNQRTPLKRAGYPKDIAELVLAVIKSDYVNGEIILADGGFSVI